MKKWSNPEVWMLGVENTKDDEIMTLESIHSGFCHKNNPAEACTGGVSDHNANGKKTHRYTGLVCKEHQENANGGEGNEACCCYS